MVIIIYFCLAIFPLTIYGSSDPEDITLEELYIKVCDVAEINGTINNVFKPQKKGFLGRGGYSFIFKGILDSINKEVAMKFTPPEDECNAEREFEVYTYLESINQTDKEAYGIPTVYYYGRWEGCVLMAITLLDKLKNYQMNSMDILIIFREFVRISKYIHSRGVCHMDFHLGNLMFRKHQGFIIDYNAAFNMYEPIWAEAPEEFEGWVSLNGSDCMKRDWRNFFTSVCPLARFEVDYTSVKNTVHRIMDIEHFGLRRVYFECAKFAFGAEPPNHDKLYKIIDEEIKRCKVPALVSWLTVTQKVEALSEMEHNSIPSIKSIDDPPAQATEAHYIKPNFDFFVKHNS